jgi:hypothetical protein
MAISGLEESDVRVELRSVVDVVAKFCDLISTSGLLLKFEKVDALTLQEHRAFENDLVDGCILAYVFVVERTLEIEKSIWSPSLGLKGQVDMVVWGTVELRVYHTSALVYLEAIRDNLFHVRGTGGAMKPRFTERLFRCVAPLELKTGKWRPTSVLGHRAQVRTHACVNVHDGAQNIPCFHFLVLTLNFVFEDDPVCCYALDERSQLRVVPRL